MICLIVGGSASGKSSFAEDLALNLSSPHYYLATMRPLSKDDDLRISKHLQLRSGKDFETIERYENLAKLEIENEVGTVLLECVCTLASNEMFDFQTHEVKDPTFAIVQGIEALSRRCANLIIVTNIIGSDIQDDYSRETSDYIQAIGGINCQIADMSDVVIEVVCGVPIMIKSPKSKTDGKSSTIMDTLQEISIETRSN